MLQPVIGKLDDFDTWVELSGERIAGMCEGDDYILQTPNIGGLGLPDTKASDISPLDRDGAEAPADYSFPRTLIVPVMWQRSTVREAMEALRALKVAWQPRHANDVLEVSIPGLGPSDDILRFWGRPRSTLDTNLEALPGGIIFALATFVALDPIGYGPEITITGSGNFTVNNPGDANTRRATVELVGDGGAPSLVNSTDGGTDVRFSNALSGGQSWFINLYDRTVVDDSGSDVFADNVLASSLWPKLLPGDNELVLDGADAAIITYRSGWW